jgi:deoxycytidine triphosphate deaminase
MLNAKQILEKGLLELSESRGKAAQVGYDLSLKVVNKIGSGGRVLVDKTHLGTYTPVEVQQIGDVKAWILTPGVYDITFWEGCNIPSNYVGLIRQRSSMLRNGTVLHSSVFDPGFQTQYMGTVMVVNEEITIEENARVAQIYFHECEPVSDEDLYSGQWQGDKQRGQ